MRERWFNLRQDFWRGLYVTLSRFELWLHIRAVNVFSRINYSSISERQVEEEHDQWQRHPYRKRR